MRKILSFLLSFFLIILSCSCGSIDKSDVSANMDETKYKATPNQYVGENTTVEEVITNPAFGDFGRLLFPVDRTVSEDMTLSEVSTSSVYVWYNYIQVDKTVEIINSLIDDANSGNQIFYNIYSEEEMQTDSSKRDTGLFFFKGEENAPFAIMNAGGGFMYVGAMHDSFPHALEASKMGYNAFALIYRPDDPYADLAKAIEFIYDNADELQINSNEYSLWGGSAGARMAATLGNSDNLAQFTGRTDIPQASAVIMQYTGYTSASASDAPTYSCVGTSDGIASWQTMENRLNQISDYGIPTEFHKYENLPHGFGIGTGTIAEGWINDAVTFWENQIGNIELPELRQIRNLQDYLLGRDVSTHGADYDVCKDGVWDVFDLCIMKRNYVNKYQNSEKSGDMENVQSTT